MQQNPGWRTGELITPDSFMRLVRIDDMLAAGRPLHAVMRDGSGHGTLLHWSHLLDGLLLALAAPLAPWLGWHAALNVIGLLSGPLSLAALGAAVAWTAAPVARPGWLWLGAFAAGSATTIRNYGLLGQVSHHVLLVLAAVMAAGWALRLLRAEVSPGAGGAAMGLWAGLGLWFSPEALPFALLGVVALWAAWFAAPEPRLERALAAHGAALLTMIVLALAVDPPAAGWLAVEPDRLSVPFVVLAAGALVTALAARTGLRWPPLLCGCAAGGAWLAAFPQVLHGTNGLMTPTQATAFFTGIVEMAPVASFADVINFLTAGLFAAAILAGFTWAGRRTNAAWPLLAATLCTVAGLILATRHIRFAAYPQAAGAVVLPVLLTTITARLHPGLAQSGSRVAAILLLTALPAIYALRPADAGLTLAATVCDARDSARLLAGHAGEIVLSQPEDTPELLYRSDIRTVGSLYHRAPAGFMRLRAAWRSIPGDAPGPELRATGAGLILGCPGAARTALVADLPQHTLMDRLDANDPPAWLTRLADAGRGGPVLYRIAE